MVWLDLGLNPRLPDHRWTLYPLGQWEGFCILETLFPCCLSIQLLCYDHFVPIFCTKFVLFLLHPDVDMSSNILPLLAGIIFNPCFRMSCFGCLVWFYVGIFLVFLLLQVPSDSTLRVVSFVLTVLLYSLHSNVFSSFSFVYVFLLVIVDFLFIFPV